MTRLHKTNVTGLEDSERVSSGSWTIRRSGVRKELLGGWLDSLTKVDEASG